MRNRLCAAAVTIALATAGAAAQSPARVTGSVHSVTVVAGDTLRSIGSRAGAEPAAIAADNGIKLNAKILPGTELRIDNRHVVPAAIEPGTLVINVPQRLLFFLENGRVAALPVAVGRRTWQTPLKAFSVATKEIDPSWEVPASIQAEALRAGRSLPAVVPPGPNNPLGKHWLGLSIGGVGIHGTNAPSSVYQSTTHGCIRLHPDDIEWLFGMVEVGTPGRFIYEPVLLASERGEIFLEVQPDIYRRGPPDVMAFVRAKAAELGVDAAIDWTRAAAVIAERAGVARSVTAR